MCASFWTKYCSNLLKLESSNSEISRNKVCAMMPIKHAVSVNLENPAKESNIVETRFKVGVALHFLVSETAKPM